MKSLVVFYSFDGNTRFISQAISEAVGAELLELKPVNDIQSHGFTKFFLGGKQVMRKETPVLSGFDKDPKNYDVIFMGTPVWAWTYVPAFATFFCDSGLKGKKIALFCCSGGQPGKTLANMKEKLLGNEFIGEMAFVEPTRSKEENAQKAKQWAKEVTAAL